MKWRMKILIMCLELGVFMCLAIALIVTTFGPFFLNFYTDSPTVLQYGQIRLRSVAIWLFLNAILDIVVGSLRGMGSSTLPTLLMLFGITGIRVGWLIFVFPHMRSLEMVLIVFPLSWFFTSIMEIILWFREYRTRFKNA